MKRAMRIVGSLALSGVFLYFAARDVSWTEAAKAFREARWIWVVPMTLAAAGTIYVRAVRWRVLVNAVRPVPLSSLVSATAIGFAANMLLPLRAGEIIRPWVLSRKEPIPFPAAAATIALERVFDMATLLVFFGLSTLVLPLPEEWRAYGWVFAASFGALLGFLLVLQRVPAALAGLEALVGRLPARIAAPALSAVRRFPAGLAGLSSARTVAAAMALSIANWLTIAVAFGAGLPAFGLDVPWVSGAIATTTFVAIAVSIPGGPGFIGMFQAGCIVALEIYGVERSVAFSYSVLTHLVQFGTTVGLGLYFFLREDLSIKDMAHVAEP